MKRVSIKTTPTDTPTSPMETLPVSTVTESMDHTTLPLREDERKDQGERHSCHTDEPAIGHHSNIQEETEEGKDGERERKQLSATDSNVFYDLQSALPIDLSIDFETNSQNKFQEQVTDSSNGSHVVTDNGSGSHSPTPGNNDVAMETEGSKCKSLTKQAVNNRHKK